MKRFFLSKKQGPFAAVRPDGRRSSFVSMSRIRAAEHVVRALKCKTWQELEACGWQVLPIRQTDA